MPGHRKCLAVQPVRGGFLNPFPGETGERVFCVQKAADTVPKNMRGAVG